MSLVKSEEHEKHLEISLIDTTEVVQCCDKHFLVDSKITINNEENISYINFRDLNTNLQLQHLHGIVREKEHHIANLEKENLFLKGQVKVLNNLLDQLSASTKTMATKNNIQIKVENVSSLITKKWYRRPKIVLSGSAIAVLFSIYLRYKIKNW